MKAQKQILNGFQEAFKTVFKEGVKQTQKQYACEAGRHLQQGDATIMSIYNSVNRALKKM